MTSLVPPWSTTRDAARARALWVGFVWILAGVLITLGAAYLLGGLRAAAASQAYEVVVRYLPGGIRSHGALMLAHGAALLYGLLAPAYRLPVLDAWLRRVLLSVCGYASWLVFAFVGSWLLTGTSTIGGLVWWSACAGFAGLLVKYPPPAGRVGRRGRVR